MVLWYQGLKYDAKKQKKVHAYIKASPPDPNDIVIDGNNPDGVYDGNTT